LLSVQFLATSDYAKLADALAADIAAGNLKPGDRLPPQRVFAYERGIAVSTASRVYTELLRRGLVVGEVGRGTFVSGRPKAGPTTAEPSGPRIDLEFNFPILPEQADLIAKSLAGLSRPEALAIALRFAPSRGTSAARELSARFLARGDWQPSAEGFLFTGNGRQAIAASIGALVPIGGRLGVEAITYPVVKGIAARLGVTLVPLPIDEAGMRPDGIAKAHREASLSALYLQPTLHNPLGTSLTRGRREDLIRLAGKLDLIVIEDTVYGFLSDDLPLAALAPERCVVVDSLSKRVAPGLGLGFISAPAHLCERLMTSVRSGGWTASGYAFEAGQRLMADGTAGVISARKRGDAKQRQRIAAECLAGCSVRADERAYHLWLTLPERWRSESFVAAAARRGIGLTPSSAFTVGHGHAPNAVRLALASPPLDQLREALQRLAKLLGSGAEDFDVTE
jgi:DNA-binding transcriptional MocR family regulator